MGHVHNLMAITISVDSGKGCVMFIYTHILVCEVYLSLFVASSILINVPMEFPIHSKISRSQKLAGSENN